MLRSWPVELRRALLQYVTGLKRVPATDHFKVLAFSDGSFSRFTARAVVQRLGERRTAVHNNSKAEITPVHVLFLPPFDTLAALEEDMLRAVLNTELVCRKFRVPF